MTFDQAQSPRLGQPQPPTNPGIQIRTLMTLPVVSPKGMNVYLADLNHHAVYTGEAWKITGGAYSKIFVDYTPPAADDEGDLWVDVSTSQLWRWNGTQWVVHTDLAGTLEDLARSDALLKVIGDIETQLDGVVNTFYDTVEPTGADEGDLWFHEITNRLYRYDGADWIEIVDSELTEATRLAGEAKLIADGKITTYYEDNPPQGLGTEDAGDLWIDKNDNKKLYRWSGSQWIDVADARIVTLIAQYGDITSELTDLGIQIDAKSTTHYLPDKPWPDTPTADSHVADEGDLWFDTDDKSVWRWNKRTWVQLTDPRISAALDKAQSAQNSADAKINHWVGTAFPWNNGDNTRDLDFGDILTRTDEGNKRYYWRSDRTWAALPVNSGAIGDSAVTERTLAADAITAKHTLTGPKIQTSVNDNTGIKLMPSGLYVYRNDGTANTNFYAGANGAVTMTGAQFLTNTGYPRLEINGNGLYVYQAADNITLAISSNGNTQMQTMNIFGNPGQTSLSVDGPTRLGLSSATSETVTVKGPLEVEAGADVSGSVLFRSGVTFFSSTAVKFNGPIQMGPSNITGVSTISGDTANMKYLYATAAPTATSTVANTRLGDSGQILYTAASARKFKQNFATAKIDISKVLTLQPQEYDYKPEYMEGMPRQVGFVADDAHALGFTQFVDYDDNGEVLNFDYARWGAVALHAVAQAQQKTIDTLKADKAALEAKTAALEKRVADLETKMTKVLGSLKIK